MLEKLLHAALDVAIDMIGNQTDIEPMDGMDSAFEIQAEKCEEFLCGVTPNQLQQMGTLIVRCRMANESPSTSILMLTDLLVDLKHEQLGMVPSTSA